MKGQIWQSRVLAGCVIIFALLFYTLLYFAFDDYIPILEKKFDYRWLIIGKYIFTDGIFSSGVTDLNGNLISTSRAVPFYPVLFYFAQLVFGVVENFSVTKAGSFALEYLRLFSVLMALGTIYFTFLIGRLFDLRIAYIAVLLAIVDLNFILWANYFGTPDIIVSFFVTVSLFFFLKFIKQERSSTNILLGALFLGLASYTKVVTYMMWAPLGILLAAFLITERSITVRRKINFLVIFFVVVGIFIGGWRIRNKVQTGFSEFSSHSGEALLMWHAAHLTAYQEGIPWYEAKVKHRKKYGVRKFSHPGEENRYWKDIAVQKILGSPVDYAILLISRIPHQLLVSEPPDYLLDTFSIKVVEKIKKQHYSSQQGNFLVLAAKVYLKLWEQGYRLYAFAAVFIQAHIIFIVLTFMVGAAIGLMDSRQRWMVLLMLGIVAYFLMLTCPPAIGRYRSPIMPLLYVLSSFGVFRTLDFIKVYYKKLVKKYSL